VANIVADIIMFKYNFNSKNNLFLFNFSHILDKSGGQDATLHTFGKIVLQISRNLR
tara:strand:- start:8075 stop:8242 length:168 start_codon:yes stop_codon:yes gene_type:complete